MKLSKITTSSGQSIEIEKFTLLVGPNNVGKSQTLKDIHKKLLVGHEASTTLISDITIDRPANFDELFEDLDVRIDETNIGHSTIDSVTSNFDNVNSLIRINLEAQRAQFDRQADADYTFLKLTKI